MTDAADIVELRARGFLPADAALERAETALAAAAASAPSMAAGLA